MLNEQFKNPDPMTRAAIYMFRYRMQQKHLRQRHLSFLLNLTTTMWVYFCHQNNFAIKTHALQNAQFIMVVVRLNNLIYLFIQFYFIILIKLFCKKRKSNLFYDKYFIIYFQFFVLYKKIYKPKSGQS